MRVKKEAKRGVMGVRKRKREIHKAEIQRLTSILAVLDSPHLKEKVIL